MRAASTTDEEDLDEDDSSSSVTSSSSSDDDDDYFRPENGYCKLSLHQWCCAIGGRFFGLQFDQWLNGDKPVAPLLLKGVQMTKTADVKGQL